MVNLVVRSTTVPMAERPVPIIRSPSQCPGTARSSASGGRSLIMTSSVDVTLRTLLCAGSRNAQRSPRSKTRDEFTFQRAAALDVERLVDRLVGDPHRLVVGKVDRQPVRDLLRAPRARPHPILSAGPVAALPGRSRRSDHRPIRCVDNTSEAILHVVTEPIIDHQFRRPGPAGQPAPPSIARPRPDTRGSLPESQRCGGAHVRPSTVTG